MSTRECRACGVKETEYAKFRSKTATICLACEQERKPEGTNGEWRWWPRISENPQGFHDQWIQRAEALEEKAGQYELTDGRELAQAELLLEGARDWRKLASELVRDGKAKEDGRDDIAHSLSGWGEYQLPLLLVKYTLVFKGELSYVPVAQARAA